MPGLELLIIVEVLWDTLMLRLVFMDGRIDLGKK
jgi:hypothetical protein